MPGRCRARDVLAASRSPSGVWRFGELVLPAGIAVASPIPKHTPLLEREALNRWCDIEGLLLKA